MKKQLLTGLTLVILSTNSFAALEIYTKKFSKGEVRFVKESGMTPEEFSKSSYTLKPDPAWLDRNVPLSAKERASISAEQLESMTQEELDQIYLRSKAGPIVPDAYKGNVLVKDGVVSNANLVLKDSKVMGMLNTICGTSGAESLIKCLGEYAWGGKRVYPVDETGVFPLRNAISPTVAVALKGMITPMKNMFEPSQWLMRNMEDFLGDSKFMLFPGKVYCGISLIDTRREAIIIDYTWGDDYKPFVKGIDDLVGRGMMNLRDEMRMIRPGLYLGRAYTNKVFLLNFVLTSERQQTEFANSNRPYPEGQCFNGTKTR